MNESNEKLRTKLFLYLHSSIPYFQDYAIKAQIVWSYYHLSSEDQNKEHLARLAGDRQRRYRSWLVNLGDQGERWREWCTRLDICDRKLAKLLLDK